MILRNLILCGIQGLLEKYVPVFLREQRDSRKNVYRTLDFMRGEKIEASKTCANNTNIMLGKKVGKEIYQLFLLTIYRSVIYIVYRSAMYRSEI